jgi:hypothetical protein
MLLAAPIHDTIITFGLVGNHYPYADGALRRNNELLTCLIIEARPFPSRDFSLRARMKKENGHSFYGAFAKDL